MARTRASRGRSDRSSRQRVTSRSRSRCTSRAAGRVPPQSHRGAAIRRSSRVASRDRKTRPKPAARSRSCATTRRLSLPIRARGGALAGTGAGPRTAKPALRNGKRHVRPANLLIFRRADVVDVGHPLRAPANAWRRASQSRRDRALRRALSTPSTLPNCLRSFFRSTFWTAFAGSLSSSGALSLAAFFAGFERLAFGELRFFCGRSTSFCHSLPPVTTVDGVYRQAQQAVKKKGTGLLRNTETGKNLLRSAARSAAASARGSTASQRKSGSRSPSACSRKWSARARSPRPRARSASWAVPIRWRRLRRPPWDKRASAARPDRRSR